MKKFIYFSILLVLVTIIFLHKQDINHENNWGIFYLWLGSFIMSFVFFLFQMPSNFYNNLFVFLKKNFLALFAVISLATFTRFFLINVYPYVSLSDPLRDAGLNALRIKRGLKVDLFGFGSYDGYGNFVPLISYLFLPFFGNSALIYKVPSAIVGISSIILTYLLATISSTKKIAFTSAIFLIGSFVHLHFSRTELLVILDSFLAPAVIISAYFSIKNLTANFLFGMMFGFCLHFYLGIRGTLVATFIFWFLFHFKHLILTLIKKKNEFISDFCKVAIVMVLFLIGTIVGGGPTLINIKSNLFRQTGTAKLIFKNDAFLKAELPEKIKLIEKLYSKSFLAFFSEPANGNHFGYNEPLLSFPLNWFFLIGIFALIAKVGKGNSTLNDLLIFTFFFVITTNQVLVNHAGDEHRLLSLMPTACYFSAYGFICLLSRFIKEKNSRIDFLILTIFLTIFLIVQLDFYFFERPTDYIFEQKEFILQKISEYVNESKDSYYLINNEEGAYNFDTLHHKEKLEFLNDPQKIQIINREFIWTILPDIHLDKSKFSLITIDEISELETLKKEKVETNCLPFGFWPKYHCPLNYFGKYGFIVYR